MPSDLVTIYVRDVPGAILDRDVAGAPVRSHIADRRAEMFGPDGHIARDTATPLRELAGGADLLIVDGRAWFPPGVTLDAWRPPSGGRRVFRVVAEHPSPGAIEQDTLAVYLPGQVLNAAEDVASGPLLQACEQILDSGAVSFEASVVFSPGLLVNGYDAVARLEAFVVRERAAAALARGVRLHDPGRVYIRGALVCGVNVNIDVDVIFEGDVILGDNVRVGAHCMVSRSTIQANTWLKPYSLVEDAEVGSGCMVGPYARLRPAARIGDACQIGNFVEIKNSVIGAASRINHHSFIGDAVLDERVTIGAGTITCNHDGTKTNQTVIGRDAYIGSGCKLVAPLRVGEAATIGAGSTITEDVPATTLTLARSRQVNIPDWRGPRSTRREQ